VRCLVRDPARLQGRAWLNQVEVAQGDMLQRLRWSRPCGCQRSVLPRSQLGRRERFFGTRFGRRAQLRNAAKSPAWNESFIWRTRRCAGRLVAAPALTSRNGAALRAAGVPVTEFRAAVIVGSGSLSFEMIRYLTERLPVMICPKWVFTRIQPIAIRNVLDYLWRAGLRCEHWAHPRNRRQDVLTYAQMMTGLRAGAGTHTRLLPCRC